MVRTFLRQAAKRFTITFLAVAGAHYCLERAEPLIQKYMSPTQDQRQATVEPSQLEEKILQPHMHMQQEYDIRKILEDAVYEP